MIITISSDSLQVLIDETNGWSRFSTKESGWKWEEERGKIVYFQSELTNMVAEDILLTGRCDLPTLDEAIKLHVPFIKGLLEHINQHSAEKHIICPIT